MTRLERLATFLTLRAIHALNTVQGTSHTTAIENQPHTTSPTNTPETKPHQPRVGTGKSPVDDGKLRP